MGNGTKYTVTSNVGKVWDVLTFKQVYTISGIWSQQPVKLKLNSTLNRIYRNKTDSGSFWIKHDKRGPTQQSIHIFTQVTANQLKALNKTSEHIQSKYLPHCTESYNQANTWYFHVWCWWFRTISSRWIVPHEPTSGCAGQRSNVLSHCVQQFSQ